MVIPKTLTRLSRTSILNLMKQIKRLEQNALTAGEGSRKAYVKNWAIYRRIDEIFAKPLSQRINYYDSLSGKINASIRDEDYETAAKLKREREYFEFFLKEEIPLTRL